MVRRQKVPDASNGGRRPRGGEQPEGIEKTQPVRRGMRKKALQHDKQPVSEMNHPLGLEVLPLPTTDTVPAGQKLPTPQLKRKRREVSIEGTGSIFP